MVGSYLRVAVVGAGFIGSCHIDSLQQLAYEGTPIRASLIVDSDLALAESVARRAGGVAYTAAMEDITHACDLVVLATPTQTHADLACEILALGKPLLIEKPIATSLSDFAAIERQAAKCGALVVASQPLRYGRFWRRARMAIERGSIGVPVALDVFRYYGYYWPGDAGAWQLSPDKSGGIIVHNGIHDIDLALWLMGAKPTRSVARTTPLIAGPAGEQTGFTLSLEWRDESVATISWECAGSPPRAAVESATLLGDKGMVCSGLSMHGDQSGPVEVADSGLSEPVEALLARQMREVMRVLRGDRGLVVDISGARAPLEVALEATEQAATGRGDLTRSPTRLGRRATTEGRSNVLG